MPVRQLHHHRDFTCPAADAVRAASLPPGSGSLHITPHGHHVVCRSTAGIGACSQPQTLRLAARMRWLSPEPARGAAGGCTAVRLPHLPPHPHFWLLRDVVYHHHLHRPFSPPPASSCSLLDLRAAVAHLFSYDGLPVEVESALKTQPVISGCQSSVMLHISVNLPRHWPVLSVTRAASAIPSPQKRGQDSNLYRRSLIQSVLRPLHPANRMLAGASCMGRASFAASTLPFASTSE